MLMYGKGVQGQGIKKCIPCLCPGTSKKALVAGAEWTRRRIVRDEARQVFGDEVLDAIVLASAFI